MNTFTVTLDAAVSVVICVCITGPQSGVNRHRTTAFSAVKRNEPSLAITAAVQTNVALKGHVKSCVAVCLRKKTVLG